MLGTGLNQCVIALELLFTYFTVLQQPYWGMDKFQVNTYYDKAERSLRRRYTFKNNI